MNHTINKMTADEARRKQELSSSRPDMMQVSMFSNEIFDDIDRIVSNPNFKWKKNVTKKFPSNWTTEDIDNMHRLFTSYLFKTTTVVYSDNLVGITISW